VLRKFKEKNRSKPLIVEAKQKDWWSNFSNQRKWGGFRGRSGGNRRRIV
jgi:hypothetical protein